MNEAERRDRISLMHAGKVLASGKPKELQESKHAETLEQAFIEYLEEASGSEKSTFSEEVELEPEKHEEESPYFSLRRLLAYASRELAGTAARPYPPPFRQTGQHPALLRTRRRYFDGRAKPEIRLYWDYGPDAAIA